ncbi:MAG TPA: glycosyltransferase family 39 protein, partial [Rhizomicrobium sp.]|nr:glycosyltransferase family 39 protein [Rhizomicrobium sp.]
MESIQRSPRGAANQALAITVAFVLLRLVASFYVGLGTNEAYAIASGRAMSLSYFDHPPLHFWLAHLGEGIFGDTRGVRLFFILMGGGTSWLMFAFTRRLFGDRAGVWAVLSLNLSGFFGFVSASWILPDGPLNFFLLAAALALAPIGEGKPLSLRRWLAAGLLTGLAALSKYHAIF